MDLYLVVGNPNTRKSSLIRSLTGCFNRSVRDILPTGGKAPLRLYARVGSLQDTRTTPKDFMAEAGRMRCAAVLCCLTPNANPNHREQCPDAASYLAHFSAEGWHLRAVVVLGQDAGGLRSPRLLQLAQSGTVPINVTARAVRVHFGWE